MKIYVAGKFEEKELVREIQQKLKDMGCTITHDWTVEDGAGKQGQELEDYLRSCAMADYEGVFTADAVLVLNHKLAFGAMVEMGLALAWGRVVYLVGPQVRDNIFFHLNVDMGMRPFLTIDSALSAIKADMEIE